MTSETLKLASQEPNRLALFISSITDYAIYMLSTEGNVVSWNAGAQKFKGYTAAEIVGQHFSRFYSDEDRAAGLPQRALRQAAESGKFEAEGWRIRKDGSRFWASVVIDAVRSERGELIGFAKITRDITDRKTAEIELEKARQALFHAQKMEAIGKVTGGIAHDFNNLLSVVTNGLALLRQGATREQDLRLIDTMEKATQRGGALIQQLLAFARQQPLQKEHRNLSRLITSFEAVLRRAGRTSTALVLDLAAGLPNVLIDTAQFETGLLNLVVNAYDATDAGGKVTVSSHLAKLEDGQVKKLPAGRYVALVVRDDGHGMTPDTLERAIEPFYTTKQVGKGTGLGLSQVYGMVQQSGGDMVIESAQGRGTTITLYFPASTEAEESADSNDVDTVLIVDDQPEVLDMTAELFRNLGFDVLTATSGLHALDVLKRHPQIGFLVSDVMMGDMSGVDLARQAAASCPRLKVLLASGHAGGGVASNGMLEGFHFLPKPYRINDVVRKLRALG